MESVGNNNTRTEGEKVIKYKIIKKNKKMMEDIYTEGINKKEYASRLNKL